MEVDPWNDIDFGDPELQRLLDEPSATEQHAQREVTSATVADQQESTSSNEFENFDRTSGETWIYPDNLPCRLYQQSITQAALFKNTLVVLPTGLGKTFIAAVVMYNIYRWYPQGKVLFLAPTRPLVAQQIDACKHIMPLPSKDTVELTGKLPRHKRFELWRTKRVFFATPQSVQSDIVGSDHDAVNDFPFEHIRLLVIDEAHKAKGRFAYTEVTQAIWQRNRNFRVLALSATPGRGIDDVAEVIRNLFISHLEVRWDNSIDVMPYIHHRSIKTIVVELGEQINKVRKELISIIDPYERQLIEADVINGSCANLSRNFLLFEQRRFRERSLHQSFPNQTAINSNFSTCVSLYHALELLERHGLRVFVNFFEQDEEGRTKFIYNMDGRLRNLIEKLRCELGPSPFDTSTSAMTNGQIAPMPSNLDFGHPKFEHARTCLLKHFTENPTSRAIVFCEYRESVLLVYRMLLQHVPILQPRCFAGHSGTGPLRALTQKQQLQIMKDFREGKSNILVATSIAEEGLDVGEVELIVCFDINTTNPTRFIQRIGRTGRKKKGNVLMLVTEGREHRLLKDVMSKKDQINKKILHSPVIRSNLYKDSPRLVPADLTPKCVKQFVKSLEQRDKDEEDEAPKKTTKTSKKGKKTKEDMTVIKPSQDLRNFFNKEKPKKLTETVKTLKATSVIIDLDDDDDGDLDAFALRAGPGAETQKSFERSFKERFREADFSDICPTSNTQMMNTPASQTRDTKHLKKVNKLLQNTGQLVTESRRKCDILKLIKSKNLTTFSKKLLLQNNAQFVKESVELMQIIRVAQSQETNLPKKEQELVERYNLVLELLGGEEGLREFLAKNELKSDHCERKLRDDFLFDHDDFNDCMKNIFQRFGEPQFNHDNYAFTSGEFQKTEAYKRMMEKTTSGTIDEGSMAEEVDMENVQQTIIDLEDITDVDSESSNSVTWQDTTVTTINNDFDKSLLQDLETISKSFSELEVPMVTVNQEIEDNSIIDCSIEDNSSRHLLGWDEFSKRVNLPAHKSTPLAKSKLVERNLKAPLDNETPDILYEKKVTALLEHETPDILAEKKEMEEISELGNETPDILPEIYLTANPIKTHENTSQKESQSTVATNIEDELEYDLDLFLEPFPEEEIYNTAVNTNANSQKENSPAIFDISDKIIKKPTLASKLAKKCFQSPPLKQKSPSPIKRTIAKNNIKSPSVFESYRQKAELHKAKKLGPNKNTIPSSLPNVAKRKRPTPRKLTLSPVHKEVIADSTDSDFEEIAPTQQENVSTIMRQRKKRRLCVFIDDEVAVSGSEGSSDGAEHTLGHYMLDSVVVGDDAADESQASCSNLHAMYMQSVKSPIQRHGAFKIPYYESFNDHSQIFSQAMDNVAPSQYVPDSFVVGDQTLQDGTADETMCPLERAEMILKQRRKAKKLQRLSPKRQTKRKVYTISDSSEED